MDNKLNALFIISSVGLFVAALIFISICIFSDDVSKWVFPAGLFCGLLSSLLNVIRFQLSKRRNNNDE